MGRKLKVSQPAVIQTELRPLDESFWIDANGRTEQWYYQNTNAFAPDRQITPLILTPYLSAVDRDTNTKYTPTFQLDSWVVKEYIDGAWVTTTITSQSQTSDYVLQGLNLIVKKNNYDATHAINITCKATYQDPRDVGVLKGVEDSIMLVTSVDATQQFPKIEIVNPATRTYNPLKDESPIFEFEGKADWNGVEPQGETNITEYPVDVDGTEEILNSGKAVAPIMDIRYGDNQTSENQEFMYRQTAGGTLVGESIDKAYIERIKGNTVAFNQIESQKRYTNSTTDTRSTIYVQGNMMNGSTFVSTVISPHEEYAGRVSKYLITAPSNANNFLLKHSGNSVDITITYLTVIPSHKYYLSCLYVSANPTISGGIIVDNKMLIDLTLIYGAGNEPATPEEFEADYERWFGKPLSYEEYDEGSLRPVLMQSVKTTGFNILDGDWHMGRIDENTGGVISINNYSYSNYLRVLPNTQYFEKVWLDINFYDSNKVFIGHLQGGNNKVFTTPSNCAYIRVDGGVVPEQMPSYNPCINISTPSKNGTYEPYNGKVRFFDVTTLKGKLNGTGNSVTIFPDGLKKAGTIQDEIFVEDGVVKAIKRVGSVDLGSLDWRQDDSRRYFISLNLSPLSTDTYNNICSIYKTVSVSDLTSAMDKTLGIGGSMIYVRDTAYSDAATFKTAMNGVMLYYELGTPEIYILDDTYMGEFVWYGVDNGNEVPIDTLPVYTKAEQPSGYGQGTPKININALYGENIPVILRVKRYPWSPTVLPPKVTKSVAWNIPPVDVITTSDKGSAVRATNSSEDFIFSTIVNQQGEIISDAKKAENMVFDWYMVKYGTTGAIKTSLGSGLTKAVAASTLKNTTPSGGVTPSTNIYCEAFLLGAYHLVNGQYVRTKD